MSKKATILVSLLFILISLKVSSGAEENDTFIYGGLAWSADDRLIAVGTSKGVNLHDGDELSLIELLYEQEFVTSLDWNPEEELIASGDVNGIIKILDVVNKDLICNIQAHSHTINSIKWSLDGNLLASNSADRTVKIWDPVTCQSIISINARVANSHSSIAWSPNNEYIASHSYEGVLTVWDVTTSDPIYSWSLEGQASAISWSPLGNLIASAGPDSAKLWDVETGNLVSNFDEYVAYDYVSAIAFSPNGQYIAYNTHSTDLTGNIRIREVATSRLVADLDGVVMRGAGGNYANAIAWNSSGDRLANMNDYGRVELWDSVPSYRLIATYEGYTSLVLTD